MIPSACNGNCGRVVHFPSRQKLFQHLREKHGVFGFQRRGRKSRQRRQQARSPLHVASPLHDAPGPKQPRAVSSPHRQWVRTMLPSAGKPSQSSAMGASSPAIGASSPAMAPEVDAQGTSLEHSATSPEMGVISPVMASLPPATGAISPVMAPLSSATGVNSPAMAPPSPVRAPASTFNPPSSEVGAISPAKASNSLNASVSPATAPTAAGGLPGSSNEADWRAVAWASFLSAQSAQPASAWTAAMAPRS